MTEPTVDVLKQLQATRVELCAALKDDSVTYDEIERHPAIRRLDATIVVVAELIEALQDCVEAQQPMAQMHATERARAALARVGGAK
ncbi:hypothetical protein RDV84_23235 [Lysobacter yananisis]|uniref:Uncharacterized protein n=1 Tax=Lysobacter yananisis TaxID=1003114 RepID=A0ABY9P777_9GAMM|nr:hypothetical protein [Lysobacter yananisis]WMT02841.1 hypothetical protein RDV84_23235 [Lysobacter yananisis]